MFKRILIIITALTITTQAEARSHHHAHHMHHTKSMATSCVETFNIMQPCAYQPNIFAGIQTIKVKLHKERVEASPNFYQSHALSYASTQIVSHPAGCPRSAFCENNSETQVIGGRPNGCPHAFCGCSASLKLFGRIVPELNLAANWRKFPPTSPAPGMAAWRSHHVFVILAVNPDGTVVAHDGNSGRHLTRIHTVSLRGYHVVDPRG